MKMIVFNSNIQLYSYYLLIYSTLYTEIFISTSTNPLALYLRHLKSKRNKKSICSRFWCFVWCILTVQLTKSTSIIIYNLLCNIYQIWSLNKKCKHFLKRLRKLLNFANELFKKVSAECYLHLTSTVS